MSSPKVITAVGMPLQVAIANNRRDVQHYLDLARQIYEQALRVERETLALGGVRSDDPPLSYEEAAARAWSEYHSHLHTPDDRFGEGAFNAGYRGVEFAHAYWQSLKHPWQEQILRRYGEVKAKEAQQQEQEQDRLAKLSRTIGAEFTARHEFTVQQIALHASSPQDPWSSRIAQTVEAILKATVPEDVPATRRSLLGVAEKPPQEMWLALQTFRLSVEQEAKNRVQAEALRIYQERQRALVGERVQQQLEWVEKTLDELEAAAAIPLAVDVAGIREALTRGEVDEAVEDRLHSLDREISEARNRQGLLEDAVMALRRQGYKTVQRMGIIGPHEIASVYLQDPRDEDRVALIQVSEQRSLMSAEVVRRSDLSGPRQQQLDKAAQERLCQALEAAQSVLSETRCVEILEAAAPGGPTKVKKDIPKPGPRVRVAPALKSRSL